MDIVEQARDIIAKNRYLALATCSDNLPWVAGLAYAVDRDYNFFFYSAKNSRHIQHMMTNPKVAFTIYDSSLPSEDVDGLQISGVGSQVSVMDLPRVFELYYTQSFPNEIIREKFKQPIEAFKELAVKRFYKIVPDKIYKIDLSIIEVDLRVEIDIELLRKVPAK